jgi:hypothetical protein
MTEKMMGILKREHDNDFYQGEENKQEGGREEYWKKMKLNESRGIVSWTKRNSLL